MAAEHSQSKATKQEIKDFKNYVAYMPAMVRNLADTFTAEYPKALFLELANKIESYQEHNIEKFIQEASDTLVLWTLMYKNIAEMNFEQHRDLIVQCVDNFPYVSKDIIERAIKFADQKYPSYLDSLVKEIGSKKLLTIIDNTDFSEEEVRNILSNQKMVKTTAIHITEISPWLREIALSVPEVSNYLYNKILGEAPQPPAHEEYTQRRERSSSAPTVHSYMDEISIPQKQFTFPGQTESSSSSSRKGKGRADTISERSSLSRKWSSFKKTASHGSLKGLFGDDTIIQPTQQPEQLSENEASCSSGARDDETPKGNGMLKGHPMVNMGRERCRRKCEEEKFKTDWQSRDLTLVNTETLPKRRRNKSVADTKPTENGENPNSILHQTSANGRVTKSNGKTN